MKILHVTFHKGCHGDMNHMIQKLNEEFGTDLSYDVMFMNKFRDYSCLRIYNMDKHLATEIWEERKDTFNMYDIIIVSDTCPLSRIFLRDEFKRRLIIWVCNRFDYNDSIVNPHKFPDAEYYDLINNLDKFGNVEIISNTPYERMYGFARGITCNKWSEVIRPSGYSTIPGYYESPIPEGVDMKNTYFVPQYHNDTNFIDLEGELRRRGINCYRGHQNIPYDLKDFKGIIHIPYAPSTLSLYGNLNFELVYFIPSKLLMERLYNNQEPNIKYKSNMWLQCINIKDISTMEWYLPENADYFVYFESFEDLMFKLYTLDYKEKKRIIKAKFDEHQRGCLESWRRVIYSKG